MSTQAANMSPEAVKRLESARDKNHGIAVLRATDARRRLRKGQNFAAVARHCGYSRKDEMYAALRRYFGPDWREEARPLC